MTICIQKDAHRPGWICRHFRGSRRAGKFKPGISLPGGKYRKLSSCSNSCSNLSHSWCMGEQLSYIHCWGVPQGSRSRPPASTGTLRYTPPVNVGNCTYSAIVFFFSFFFYSSPDWTPVTLCSGEWWSVLVVRLTHSADPRSRLCHVSCAPSAAYSTRFSRVVTHAGLLQCRSTHDGA